MSIFTGPEFAFVGVVHLLPLPAGPRSSAGFDTVYARAMADAKALAIGGARAAILENLGDAPFSAGAVEPHVVAFLARLASDLRREVPALELGINLLRNDAYAAMGVAAACGAQFIRVNVHTGAMLTDQGVIEGRANHTLRYRQALGADVRIVADVLVKHAVPLAPMEIGPVAADTFHRGGADVLIVSGEGTGRPADPARAAAVRAYVPEARVWVGSGVTLQTAPQWRERVHGAIVGTWLHAGARLDQPVDAIRVSELASALGASATG